VTRRHDHLVGSAEPTETLLGEVIDPVEHPARRLPTGLSGVTSTGPSPWRAPLRPVAV
jgi:hypothetical protein